MRSSFTFSSATVVVNAPVQSEKEGPLLVWVYWPFLSSIEQTTINCFTIYFIKIFVILFLLLTYLGHSDVSKNFAVVFIAHYPTFPHLQFSRSVLYQSQSDHVVLVYLTAWIFFSNYDIYLVDQVFHATLCLASTSGPRPVYKGYKTSGGLPFFGDVVCVAFIAFIFGIAFVHLLLGRRRFLFSIKTVFYETWSVHFTHWIRLLSG